MIDMWFQSTHSLRSATKETLKERNQNNVSIHALLAECDSRGQVAFRPVHRFNPRTPCGVRPVWEWGCQGMTRFQSTHSLRSATVHVFKVVGKAGVSIHALLAECDRTRDKTPEPFSCFNPRTPCGVRRSDDARPNAGNWFQSTHSLRSATLPTTLNTCTRPVSIHALLAECDRRQVGIQLGTYCFNPRTPCGVRHDFSLSDFPSLSFQSTHSLRSATFVIQNKKQFDKVSIHALLAECDETLKEERKIKQCFNPRTPCGVRPFQLRRTGR